MKYVSIFLLLSSISFVCAMEPIQEDDQVSFNNFKNGVLNNFEQYVRDYIRRFPEREKTKVINRYASEVARIAVVLERREYEAPYALFEATEVVPTAKQWDWILTGERPKADMMSNEVLGKSDWDAHLRGLKPAMLYELQESAQR